jgi:hypothetical protein
MHLRGWTVDDRLGGQLSHASPRVHAPCTGHLPPAVTPTRSARAPRRVQGGRQRWSSFHIAELPIRGAVHNPLRAPAAAVVDDDREPRRALGVVDFSCSRAVFQGDAAQTPVRTLHDLLRVGIGQRPRAPPSPFIGALRRGGAAVETARSFKGDYFTAAGHLQGTPRPLPERHQPGSASHREAFSHCAVPPPRTTSPNPPSESGLRRGCGGRRRRRSATSPWPP